MVYVIRDLFLFEISNPMCENCQDHAWLLLFLVSESKAGLSRFPGSLGRSLDFSCHYTCSFPSHAIWVIPQSWKYLLTFSHHLQSSCPTWIQLSTLHQLPIQCPNKLFYLDSLSALESIFSNGLLPSRDKSSLVAVNRSVEETNRVSYFEPRAGFEAWDELSIQTGGVKGQWQLLWNTLELQLHLRANFLTTPTKRNNGKRINMKGLKTANFISMTLSFSLSLWTCTWTDKNSRVEP